MSVITLSDNRLGNFYLQNPTFDILTFNFSNQTALSQLNWQGLNQADIVDLLKKYQRLLRLNPDPAVAQNLLTGSQTPIPPSPPPTSPSSSSTPSVAAPTGETSTPVAMPAHSTPPVAVVEPSSTNPILTSAHEIAAIPEAEFVQTYSTAVGGKDAARDIYRNAKDTEARTMLLWANARALAAAPHFQSMRVNNISDSLVEHFQSLPSYQDMFGSLNYCECEHCRSIFSPAAYFVDLMRIAKENIKHKAPEAGKLDFSLDARRPDLKDIPLTCENTNNEIPYLDIVNKALALNVASSQPAPTSPENEEQKIDYAYQTLATANYPFNLPFNLPLEQIRAYLRQLNTDLVSIYRVFNPPLLPSEEAQKLREQANNLREKAKRLQEEKANKPEAVVRKLEIEVQELEKRAEKLEQEAAGLENDKKAQEKVQKLRVAIARESLRLSIEEYNLITQPKPNSADLSKVYGLPENSLGTLVDTDTFLERTGLSRKELQELCYQNLSQAEIDSGIARSFFINRDLGQTTYFRTTDWALPNLVGYWSLNEGSGTEIGDRTGSNNGTLQGNATWITTTDFPGTASRPVLQFDGTSNYVTLANASELGLTDSDFTVEAWFKADDLSSHQAILCTDAYSDNRGLHLMIMNQKAYMGFYANDLAGQTTLVGGRWYHIAWRYTKSTGEQAIFINGELDASSQGHLPFAGKTSVNIGRWAGATYFKGQIAEVRIWNTPLSSNEVLSHYLNPILPDPATLDRIDRFIRLAKKLNWSFSDLDWVLTSLQASEITSDVIQQIAKIKQLKDKLNLPLDVLCSFWHDLKTIGVGDSGPSQALFDVVFNNPQLLGTQDPYHPEYKGEEFVNPLYQTPNDKLLKSPKDNSRIAAGLRISLDDLTALLNAPISRQFLVSIDSSGTASGTETRDRMSSHYGILKGNTAWVTTTAFSKDPFRLPDRLVLQFDGQASYATIPNSDDVNFDQNQDFTIEVWIKPEAKQLYTQYVDNSIIEKPSALNNSYAIRYYNHTEPNGNSEAIYAIRSAGSEAPLIVSKKKVNDGKFHHIAFTKQGSQLCLYVDGELQGQTEDTTKASTKNDSPVFIASRTPTSHFFKGQIADVRIRNRVLSNDVSNDKIRNAFHQITSTIIVQIADLNVQNLSVLYRHSKLASLLGLPIEQYLLSLRLLNKQKPALSVQDIIDIFDFAIWLRFSGFNVYELDYLLNDHDSKYVTVRKSDEQIQEFLRSLWALESDVQPQLKMGDIIDWYAFCTNLNNSGFFKKIWELCSSVIPQVIQQATQDITSLKDEQKLAIIQVIKIILQHRELYQASDLSDVQVQQLNRHLLQFAFPSGVIKDNDQGTLSPDDILNWSTFCTNLNNPSQPTLAQRIWTLFPSVIPQIVQQATQDITSLKDEQKLAIIQVIKIILQHRDLYQASDLSDAQIQQLNRHLLQFAFPPGVIKDNNQGTLSPDDILNWSTFCTNLNNPSQPTLAQRIWTLFSSAIPQIVQQATQDITSLKDEQKLAIIQVIKIILQHRDLYQASDLSDVQVQQLNRHLLQFAFPSGVIKDNDQGTLSPDDILNWSTFCTNLNNPSQPALAQRVWRLLDPIIQAFIAESDETKKSNIAQAITSILQHRDLYQASDLSDAQVQQLNRHLLQFAFPSGVIKNNDQGTLSPDDILNWSTFCTNLNNPSQPTLAQRIWTLFPSVIPQAIQQATQDITSLKDEQKLAIIQVIKIILQHRELYQASDLSDVQVQQLNRYLLEFVFSSGVVKSNDQGTLSPDDILNWSIFCIKLINSSLYAKIWSCLPSKVQQTIQQDSKYLEDEQKLTIVQALNKILEQSDFYQGLNTSSLLEEAKILLTSEAVRSQNEIQKLNRLLLEAAYPHEIAKGTIRKVGDEWKEKLLEHLATFLGGTADIIEALLETIAQNRTVDNTHSYIEAFLTPPQDSQQNPNHDYIESVIHLLARGLLLNQKLQFTPIEIDSVRSHPQCFLIPDCQTMSIDNLKNLWIFKQLTRAFNDTQNQLLDFLTKQQSAESLQQSAESLEKITGWSKEQITELITNHFHNALTSVTGIAQLKQVFDLSSAIGVNISFHDQILALADSSSPTSWSDYKNAAQSILEVVKAKYHDDDWAKVSDRLNRSLNESKRNALASFVLWQLQQRDASIKTLRQLSEYLLLDVETTGCASISPIKQATLSLQMYLQRCRMNLEPGVVKVDIPAVWWEWMMNYRVWEANRKVFLYPENYIEPNLRKNKTDLFKELESELLQTEITQESVEAAYRNYFDKLAELAKLRVAATYRCHVQKNDATSNNPTDDTLFIFGKTATEPRTYYYRTCINPTATPPTWNPWTKIDLNINSDYISPVFAFNKLFVFWVEIKETTDSSMTDGKTQKTTTRKATIKYTFQIVSQKWVQPQTLREDIVISRQDTSQQIQHIEPIWRKVYPLPIPEKSSSPEEILIAFGDILTQKNSWDHQFSTPASTLSNDLLIENKSLILKTTNSQAVLIENYVLDFATSKPRDSLVASWLLNEGEGKTISDQANHNNGTLQGNETWVITRVTTGTGLRSVLQFDGSTSYIEIPATAINNLQSGTIEAWVYLEDINCATILSKQHDNVNAYSVFSVGYRVGAAANPGTLHFYSHNAGGQVSSNGTKIQPRRWTHIAVTFSGQSATLYIDGRAAGTQTGDFTIPDDTTPTTTRIGSWGGRYFLSGKLANIRIWNVALTPEQILSSACLLIIDLSKADSSVLTVKNQPNWFTYDNGDEAFLVVPQGVQPSLISESLQITDDSSLDAIELTYQNTSQETSDDRFVFTRLTTSTTRQLSQKAFIGGIDRLLTLDSQLTPELDFSRFNPSPSVIPPTSQALDFKGAFGLYFQEIFFHIPFLVANTLNANQRFAEAQKWYHYIFNPTQPQPQLPQPQAYWPLDEGSGNSVKDQVGANNGTLQGNPQWTKAFDFSGTNSRSVLQFNGNNDYVTIPASSSLNSITTITWEVWFKPASQSGQKKVLWRESPGGIQTYWQDGTICVGAYVDGAWQIAGVSGYVSDQWYHVIGVVDGYHLYLFINGELQKVIDCGTLEPGINEWHLASWNKQGYNFKGQIANVRIWNIALSPEQILDSTSRSPSDRFWRYLPFRGNTLEKLQELLRNDKAVTAYNNDPFDPHAIAQLRIGAYQKAIVMKYIDNLLDWGDSLYAQDTWESITQATMLYLLAYDLLGSKPEDLGKCPVPSPKTFDEIQKENPTKIPQFLIDLEQMVGNSQTSTLTSTPFNNLNTYFGISENEQFIAYWDRVEDRLYKIRHCQNLEGIVRQLALYEPPINPMELVRAVAAGNVPMSVVSGLTATVPHYRFDHILDRAKNITSTLIQLGSSLLSALEKKDAEQLSLLRASQESAILRLIKITKENQVKEAQANLECLDLSHKAAENRRDYYIEMIKKGISDSEHAGQINIIYARDAQAAAALVRASSAFAGFLTPTIFGFANGGQSYGHAIDMLASLSDSTALSAQSQSSLLTTQAQYDRRDEEWQFQLTMANDEITLINQQIAAAQINIEIATSELNAHQKSIEHADEVENFFKTKFSTPDLYQWMVSRLSTLYFQTFKIALDMALAAQKAYQYELNKDDTYISFDYWDSLKKGLLAGEGLMLGLNQLEKAYLEGNERRLEIEKTISLLQLDPQAFLNLKNTGTCQFSLSEKLFDYDFPGHYCRQIKTISISIPAVVGPYQNIKATLTQLSDKTLLKPDSDVVQKSLKSESVSQVDPSILRTSWRRNQKIALSKGINDTGLFELSFRDERYLPFEGTGAISTWELSLPKSTNQINFDNLTDVIITLSYTALDAGEGTFKQTVQTALNPCEWFYYISLNQTFPSEWNTFVTSKKMNFTLSPSILPSHMTKVQLKGVSLSLDGSVSTPGSITLTISPPSASPTPINSTQFANLAVSSDQFSGEWSFTGLPENIENLELVLKFSGEINWNS